MQLASQLITLGRKWVHPQTNWIHYHPHTKWGEAHVAIPTYENLLFILCLFESKNPQNFLEGKERLERLLAYDPQPKFLHEWPSNYVHWRLAAPFKMIKENWGKFLSGLVEKFPEFTAPNLPEGVSIESLIYKKNFEEIKKYWSLELGRYLGPENVMRQDGIYPEMTPLDGILRYHILEPKIPENATPEWLNLILIDEIPPINSTFNSPFHWGDANQCHTLHAPKEFDFSEKEEMLVFLNRQDGSTITVNGKRSMTFGLDDKVEVHTPTRSFQVKLDVEGKGEFLGHIAMGNRPNQMRQDMEAYDWVISLRALRQDDPCKAALHLL